LFVILIVLPLGFGFDDPHSFLSFLLSASSTACITATLVGAILLLVALVAALEAPALGESLLAFFFTQIPIVLSSTAAFLFPPE